jgi:hypothetical protein
MTDVDANLNKIIEADYELQETPKNLPVAAVPETTKQDYDYSRMNHYSLIERGSEALDGILAVARESQHPRAYEVAATMMKNLSDMTDKLILLQKQKQEMERVANPTPTQVTVDKAVFVGSTTELLRKIKNESANTQ